jgi:hypothetical protein
VAERSQSLDQTECDYRVVFGDEDSHLGCSGRTTSARVPPPGSAASSKRQSADRYAQAVSNELLSRAQGDTESHELVGRLATVSSAHLRDVTALPTEVVSHFNSELARPEEAEPRKRKAARGKAAA